MGFSSGLVGGLHRITNWIMRLSIINILWFILNLPIAVTIFSAIQHNAITGVILYLLPVLLFVPFLFFPSTTALFATARDWVMEREQQSLVKTYLSNLKRNYKQSFISGLIWTVVWVIWLVDLYYLYDWNDLLTVVLLIVGLFLFVMNINFFSVLAHYHMNVKELFKNTFFVTIGSPILVLTVLIINFILVKITIDIWFLLPFFSGAISGLLCFYVFYRFTLKVQKKTTENRN